MAITLDKLMGRRCNGVVMATQLTWMMPTLAIDHPKLTGATNTNQIALTKTAANSTSIKPCRDRIASANAPTTVCVDNRWSPHDVPMPQQILEYPISLVIIVTGTQATTTDYQHICQMAMSNP